LLFGVGLVPELGRWRFAGFGEENGGEESEHVGDSGEMSEVLAAVEEADERSGEAAELFS
jgi:hypothetical protein